jgi:hypothetical protein
MKPALKLIRSLMEDSSDSFNGDCSNSLRDLVLKKSADSYLNCIEGIFESKKRLHNEEEINEEVMSLLNTSIGQNSNINIVLEDDQQVVLQPSDTRQIFKVFDKLNEHNQISLINNLIKSKVNFESTLNFCHKVKK